MKRLLSVAVVRPRQAGQVAAVMLVLAIGGVAARAHKPHDEAKALSLSPTFSQDGIAFAVTSGRPLAHRKQLMRTQDGGLSWTRVVRGLENRDSFDAILVSPAFPSDQTVFASGRADGIYRSQDGGTSWQNVSAGLPSFDVRALAAAIDAQGQLVLLAAGDNGGLQRSEDLGATWTSVLGSYVGRAIAFSPRFSQNGVVAAGDVAGNIWRSGDRGQTWSLLVGSETVGRITGLAISEGGTSFIATEDAGLFRTDDGGRSFQQLNDCLPNEPIRALALSPEFDVDQTLFLATSNEGVFQSTDGGLCWTKFDAGLVNIDDSWFQSNHFRQLQVSPDFAADQTIFVAMYDGLFKSSDSGHTWFQLETVPESIIEDFALSPNFANDATLGLARYGGGVSISTDGAATWSPSNVGLAKAHLYDLDFSPAFSSDQTVFTLYSGWLAPKSVDGGSTWSLGPPAPGVFTTMVSFSPAYASDQTLFLGTRFHGLFRSTDGGSTFVNVFASSGIDGDDFDRVESLAISSGYASDLTVFTGVQTDGVLRSTDGGNSWQVANGGLVRDPSQGPQLQISPVFPQDQTLFAATRMGLFRSTDAGQNWTVLTIDDNPFDIPIDGVAISPDFAVDRMLLVSARGRGLYKSIDWGDSWTEVGTELIAGSHVLRRIVFSAQFASDRTVLGITDIGLFRSTDGGESWVQIDAGPVRTENDQPRHQWLFYEGDWQRVLLVDASLRSVHFSPDADARASFFFNGTGVDWIGVRAKNLGFAEVYLDGLLQGVVDQYGIPPVDTLQTLFSIQGLASGFHELELVATGEKNPDSTGFGLVVDALDVLK